MPHGSRTFRSARNTRLHLASIALLTVTLTVACERAPPEPLRVGLLVWPPCELDYLAAELGYFEGESIEFVDYLSPAETIRAYRHGLIDVAAVTTTYVLALAEEHRSPRIILCVDVSAGSDALVVRADLTAPEDLRAARIGVERSTLGIFMLHRALSHLGLSEHDIDLVWTDLSDQETAFRRGHFADVVTYEPNRVWRPAGGWFNRPHASVQLESSQPDGQALAAIPAR